MKFEYSEGATPLDCDEMKELKPLHITKQNELDEWESNNILTAMTWLKGTREEVLSEKFIKILHEKMFDKTWRWAGKFRKSNKNIGVNWETIATRLHDLLNDVRVQIQHKSFSNDEIAVRFHHRLVSIHCFPNGNGRHARLVCDKLLEILKVEKFSWGARTSNDLNETRKRYIQTLQAADKGDYRPLLDFVRS